MFSGARSMVPILLNLHALYDSCSQYAERRRSETELEHYLEAKSPPKVCSFLWRAAHNCLPTCSDLIQKGVPCSDTCVHCDVLAETHTHLFIVCPKAIICWEVLQLDTTIYM